MNDSAQSLHGVRIRARIFDQALQVAHEDEWTADLPPNGRASEPRAVQWPIPANTLEGYLFLELSLRDPKGVLVSQRVYWLRILHMLADPETRKRWQAGPVLEPLTQTGPWLKPQVAALPTSVRGAAILEPRSTKEAELRVTVTNTGKLPAYPVRVQLEPDTYSVLWSDNYFWLAPGETATLEGTVRLDMGGLDPITRPKIASRTDLLLKVSAWNAPAVELRP